MTAPGPRGQVRPIVVDAMAAPSPRTRAYAASRAAMSLRARWRKARMRQFPGRRWLYEARRAAGTAVSASMPGLAAEISHRTSPASIASLQSISRCWTTEAGEAFAALLPHEELPLDEFRSAIERIERHGRLPPCDPQQMRIGDETAAMLFGLVWATMPRVALETGVADGLSTSVILDAMDGRGIGVLHSIEISDDVGSLVSSADRWTLHVGSGSRREFASILDGVGPIDLFFHDGHHSYHGQMAEYRGAWQRLRPGGVLASDDVDMSRAFVDFCAANNLSPVCVLDGFKVSGFLVKNGP